MAFFFRERWYVNPIATAAEQTHFESLDAVFALVGERVTGGDANDVIKFQTDTGLYYIKRYRYGGKGLRRYFAKSRAKREWLNLLWFKLNGIRTVDWVAFAEESCLGMHRRAVIVTRAVPDSKDLVTLFESQSPKLKDWGWRMTVGHQIMEFVARLHRAGFVHGDLKWRNILLGGAQQEEVYFIDCPQGRLYTRGRLQRGLIKDLACLAKRAPFVLSRHEQMTLLKHYLQFFNDAPPPHVLARAIMEEQYTRYKDFYL